MRRLLHFALLLFVLPVAHAQYIPNSAQAFQFASAYNPAFSGIDNFGDLKVSYRYQWTGYGADAPHFINLAYNARLKQPVDLSSNASRISNVSVLGSENLPKSKRTIQGFGVIFFNERYGRIKRTGGGVNYAFNFPISIKTRLAVGASVLVDNTKVDISNITVREPDDDYYNQLVSNGTTQTNLNVRMGALLYSPRYYVGISYFPVVNAAIQKADLTTNQIFYQGSVQAGIAFPISANASIRPSILALWQVDNKLVTDYSVKAFIQSKVWFGVTYRSTQSGIGMIGLNINEKISVAYSYEMSLSDYSQFTNASHDLVLSFRFNNFKKQSQYTW